MNYFEIDHPIKRLRLAAGLTQEQLAHKVPAAMMSQVSEQYIRRVEQGLIGQNTNLDVFFKVLFKFIEKRHEEEARPDFLTVMTKLMSEYIVAATDLNGRELNSDDNTTLRGITGTEFTGSMALNLSLIVDDWYLLLRLHTKANMKPIEVTTFRTFREFRLYFMHQVGVEGLPSLYSFCRSLGLHVFTIQRFDMQHRANSPYMDGAVAANWPADLRHALYEVGVDWSKIKFTGRDHA